MVWLVVELTACANGGVAVTPVATSRYALSALERTALEEAVKETLKDPGSAMFSDVAATSDSDGTVFACGNVNAKNSFGGYTGKQPFFGSFALAQDKGANARIFVPIGVGGDGIAIMATRKMCSKYGITIL